MSGCPNVFCSFKLLEGAVIRLFFFFCSFSKLYSGWNSYLSLCVWQLRCSPSCIILKGNYKIQCKGSDYILFYYYYFLPVFAGCFGVVTRSCCCDPVQKWRYVNWFSLYNASTCSDSLSNFSLFLLIQTSYMPHYIFLSFLGIFM